MQSLLRKLYRVLGLSLALAVGPVGGAAAAPAVPPAAKAPSQADAQKIRSVIEAQIAAFAAEDAHRAFSYAAPQIRNLVGTPERFMEMVRTTYPVVYRPSSVTFLLLAVIDGTVMQAVQMTDSNGGLWLAIYSLQRQRDKSWRISGCMLQKGEGQVI